MVIMCAGGIIFGTSLGLVHIRWKRGEEAESLSGSGEEDSRSGCLGGWFGRRRAPRYYSLGMHDSGDRSDDDLIADWGAEVLEECERYKEPTALGIALRRASPCAQSDVGTGGMHIHGSLAYDIPNPSNLCDDIDNPNIYLTLNPAFSGGRFQYAGVGGVGERHHRPQLSITPPHERFTTLPAVYAAAAESDEDNP